MKAPYHDFIFTKDQYLHHKDSLQPITGVRDLKEGVPYLVFWAVEDSPGMIAFTDTPYKYAEPPIIYYGAIFTINSKLSNSTVNKHIAFTNPELTSQSLDMGYPLDTYGDEWFIRRIL